MTEKYLIVKMAPFGTRYCVLPRATIGEIEPGQRKKWKNRFGLSHLDGTFAYGYCEKG
jgi:hypothetical protein